MRTIIRVTTVLLGLGLSFGPSAARADDDWDDYWEDYYEEQEEAREDYQEDLEDYYEDLEDRWKDQARYRYRYGDGYAAEPYWSYPQEYYIFGGHPSRYYYSYPDRYYTQRRLYTPPYRSYGYRSDPNIWRYDVYGYYRPYGETYGRYDRYYGAPQYKRYDRGYDGYRYRDGKSYRGYKR